MNRCGSKTCEAVQSGAGHVHNGPRHSETETNIIERIIERIIEHVPASLVRNSQTGIQAGDIVTVLPYEEIRQTLDQHNCCDGLLFMPNMRQYCDRQLEVLKPVKWVYDEKYREMLSCEDIVVLSGATCDGKGMLQGMDCDRRCTLFWKTAWLRKASSPERMAGQPSSITKKNHITSSKLSIYRKTPPNHDIRPDSGTMGYMCQYTCLDMMGREFNAAEIALHISLRTWASMKRRMLHFVEKDGMFKSNSYPYQAIPSGADRQGSMSEDLMCGDVVEVLPYARIEHTLDSKGRCKGLRFMPDMKDFCGQRSTVLAKPRYILDHGGDKVRKAKDIIILDNFYCSGANIYGCDRACLCYWRKDWLMRVPEPASGIP